MEADQKFLETLIGAIVDNPKDVKVDRKVDEMGVLLTLTVHQEDMGKIIGQRGATARSIRSLLRIVGMKNNARVNLKIEEPEGSTYVRKEQEDDAEPKEKEEEKTDASKVDEAIGELDI